MLGTLDEAYVHFRKERPFQVGERYTIYRLARAVKHPVTGKYLGHIVEILGEGEVRAVTDGKIARIGIVDSINPIERGYLVGPLKRAVQGRAAGGRTSRTCRASSSRRCSRTSSSAPTIIVFVDRGKADGVEVGNRFIVTRRGDGYQPLLSNGPMDDRRFPRETIGRLLVDRSARSHRHRLHDRLDGRRARRRSRRAAPRLLRAKAVPLR